MAPYNDKYCISCANRTEAGGMTFCKVQQCKRIPTKRQHVNAVEFIPEAGVLIVRTRYYSEVQEIILAHRDEDGRTFKEEKGAEWIDVNSIINKAVCSNCGQVTITEPFGKPLFCQWCGAVMEVDT